jgi:hypothetical protein
LEPITCPHCQAVLTAELIVDGWCEECGKKIPPYLLDSVPGLARQIDALRSQEAAARAELQAHECFFCGRHVPATAYHVRFLTISQSVIPGVLVTTTQHWAFARCYCCEACKGRIIRVKVWTILLMLAAALLPVLSCVLYYLPMVKAKQESLFLAITGLILPWVLAFVGIFGGMYLRRRKFAAMLPPDSRSTLEDRLGVRKIHDISFRETAPRGQDWLDLTAGR